VEQSVTFLVDMRPCSLSPAIMSQMLCYHLTTIFKIVTANIWLHHWKGMIIARRRISLIYLGKFDTDYNQCSCCGYEIIRHANFIAYRVSIVGYRWFRSSGLLRRVDW